MPGIGKDNYFVKQINLEKDVPDYPRWGDTLENKIVDGENRTYLDLLGRTMDLLVQLAHVAPEHIEAYDVDTYEAAQRGEAYSHRYAIYTHQPEKNGRMIIAAELLEGKIS